MISYYTNSRNISLGLFLHERLEIDFSFVLRFLAFGYL